MTIKQRFAALFTAVLILLGVTTTALAATLVKNTSVTVTVNQQQYTFTERPRLVEVLAPQALSQPWYWPASKLFLLNAKPEMQRQQLLQQLQALIATTNQQLKPGLAALQKELTGWQLGQRIPIRIDYDLARADAALNPRFEPGQYQLLLTERPTGVRFFGAVPYSVTMKHIDATTVQSYLVGLPLLSVADPQFVVVIQPDGRILNAGTQSWNWQHLEVMPGAMVYIPFATGWFSADFSALNKHIPALAVHRMY